MIDYNKQEIRELLPIDEVFNILEEFGGEPYYMNDSTIISRTICHNEPQTDASHKLYYYNMNKMFHCYSGCSDPSFDIFQLIIKVSQLQWHKDMDLNEAVRWVAFRIGYSGEEVVDDKLEDWDFLKQYEDLKDIHIDNNEILLKEFDKQILDRFNYNCKIKSWLRDGISQEVMDRARIGFYPGEDKITIPHFDKYGRFIGLRGRTLCKEEAELYGKYRPLKIHGIQYNHPLGFALYGLDRVQENIKRTGKAIVVEGEKSVLLGETYLGEQNNIVVATCGSNLSAQQFRMLLEAGANEICIAYDKQWKVAGDEEYRTWTKKLKKINDKFSNQAVISFLIDKSDLLGYKDSPFDRGKETFLQLFKERIII